MVKRHRDQIRMKKYIYIYWVHRLFTDFYYSTILLRNNHTLLKSPRLFSFYSFLYSFNVGCDLIFGICSSIVLYRYIWIIATFSNIPCGMEFSIFISSLFLLFFFFLIYNRIRGKYNIKSRNKERKNRTKLWTMNTSPLNIVSNNFRVLVLPCGISGL